MGATDRQHRVASNGVLGGINEEAEAAAEEERQRIAEKRDKKE